MKIDFTDDPQFLAAVQAGIVAALCSPQFIRALALAMGPEAVWLTAQQARGITQLAPSTFARWCRKHREKLVISHALGGKEPRYRYDSVQQIMQAAAVGGEPATSKLVVLPEGKERGTKHLKAS